MKYKTHITGSLALGYVAINNIDKLNINLTNSKTFFITSAGLIIGALISDIDKKESYLGRKVWPFSVLTSKVFKHREFTHSILGTMIMAALMYLLLLKCGITTLNNRVFITSFTIGIISHIFLDLMTTGGVVLLYPFYKKRISIGDLKVTRFSVVEFILVILFSVIAYRSLALM